MTSAAGEHPRWLDPLSQSLAALPAPPKGGALFVPTFRKQAPPSGELANAVSLRGFVSRSGPANAAFRYDPSREKAILENPQIFQNCEIK